MEASNGGAPRGTGVKICGSPEISIVRLTPSHLFFVVASDGVFEFLSSQTVVNKAAAYKDPSDACAAIAGDSYKRWLELENRTNDITIIIVQIKGLSNSGVGTTDSELHSRPCQIGGSMNQSTAIVPPLMHQRPLESVGHSSCSFLIDFPYTWFFCFATRVIFFIVVPAYIQPLGETY
ncbi:hypothetical protein ES288_D01G159500v1 [Gossypium darwinii]|uniref:PPM-type phosphatase domain-containing protein n=1 Tax=Gossypium darwinii TaxID=34276 RepID=A0A5D2DQQ8_GOSDA|nr:hypothetical protein ES288_D01G159500v1 [Gossypium darwinii]